MSLDHFVVFAQLARFGRVVLTVKPTRETPFVLIYTISDRMSQHSLWLGCVQISGRAASLCPPADVQDAPAGYAKKDLRYPGFAAGSPDREW